jgi:hypothetical protein
LAGTEGPGDVVHSLRDGERRRGGAGRWTRGGHLRDGWGVSHTGGWPGDPRPDAG